MYAIFSTDLDQAFKYMPYVNRYLYVSLFDSHAFCRSPFEMYLYAVCKWVLLCRYRNSIRMLIVEVHLKCICACRSFRGPGGVPASHPTCYCSRTTTPSCRGNSSTAAAREIRSCETYINVLPGSSLFARQSTLTPLRTTSCMYVCMCIYVCIHIYQSIINECACTYI